MAKDFEKTIIKAIENNATDEDLAKLCRQYFDENCIPRRGKQWTKRAFEVAQQMLDCRCKVDAIAARLNELFVGKFSVGQVRYQIYAGALKGRVYKRERLINEKASF